MNEPNKPNATHTTPWTSETKTILAQQQFCDKIGTERLVRATTNFGSLLLSMPDDAPNHLTSPQGIKSTECNYWFENNGSKTHKYSHLGGFFRDILKNCHPNERQKGRRNEDPVAIWVLSRLFERSEHCH
jgi:hypothetical protein